MKHILVIAAILSLSACATRPPAAPIVDTKGQTEDQRWALFKDTKECRSIQQRAMPVKFWEAMAQPDVHRYNQQREEKSATIMRECLRGRGHAIIY